MSWIEDPGVESFGSYIFEELNMNQAFLNVSSGVSQKLWLYSLSSNCHTCPYQRVGNETAAMLSSAGDVHKVFTSYSMKYRFRTSGIDKLVHYDREDTEMYCDTGPVSFGEFGIYELRANTKVPGNSCFKFTEVREPVSIYYPFLIAFLVYLALAVVINLYKFLFNRRDSSTSTSSASTSSSSSQVPPAPAPSYPPPHSTLLNGNPSINPGGGGDAGVNGGFMAKSSLSASRTSIASHRSQRSSVGSLGHPHQGAPSEYSSYMAGEPPYKPYSVGTGPPTVNSDYGQGVAAAAARRNSAAAVAAAAVVAAAATASQQQATEQPRQLQRQRLQSLDTFRGICIVVMIFVNDGGAGYYFLEHANWDGLYIADLVFPWFLWIMGVCIPVSIKSQRKRNVPRLKIFAKIIVRSLKLVGIGLILASLWGPVELSELRLPGVLQRFGICYFVCSTLVLLYMNVNFSKPGTQSKFSKLQGALQDVEIIWIGWIAILCFVMIHCLLTFFLRVPGCPTGYLGPGGLHENAAWSSLCIGGASGYIDRKIFTEKHIYNYPTANDVYAEEGGGKAYDPEGALGTLTSFLQVWCGVQTGVTMTVYPKAGSRVKRWLIWAVMLGAMGTLLCGAKETGGWIPINKNLWSLSFVLVTSSFALILLSFLYFIIDIKKWWSGTPFYEPGMNSILLYVGHSVGHQCLPWHWRYGRMSTHAINLFESLWGTSLWVIIAVYLNCKKIFWVL